MGSQQPLVTQQEFWGPGPAAFTVGGSGGDAHLFDQCAD